MDHNKILTERILGALKAGPKSGAEIAKLLKRRSHDVRAVCDQLAGAGSIVRDGKVWVLAGPQRCRGTNDLGLQCGREAHPGSPFCSMHQTDGPGQLSETEQVERFLERLRDVVHRGYQMDRDLLLALAVMVIEHDPGRVRALLEREPSPAIDESTV